MSLLQLRREAGGAWLRVILDAPPGNVLTMEMVGELRGVLAEVESQPDLKLLSIEGAGDHFSFGASIVEHLPPAVSRMLPSFHALVRELLEVPVPTAAIVRGRCLGGGLEVALCCDVVFAAQGAKLGVPEVTLGVFPPAAAALLPWRVGAGRASRAVITGEVLPAPWWFDAGLVTMIAPEDGLESVVREWFDRHVAPRSAVGLRLAAYAGRETLRRDVAPALDALERQYLETLVATHDGIEGCAAFVEKRPPIWTNR